MTHNSPDWLTSAQQRSWRSLVFGMARLQERLNAETVENYGVTTGDLDKVRTIAPSHVAIVREYLVDLLTPEEFATIGKAFERVLMSLNPSDTARLPDA